MILKESAPRIEPTNGLYQYLIPNKGGNGGDGETDEMNRWD
jgi:hypothetical protein